MRSGVPGPRATRAATTRALGLAAAVTCVLLAAIWLDLSPLLRGPEPFPPQWQWNARQGPPAAGLPAVVLCAAGLMGLITASGLVTARRYGRIVRAIVLCAAVALGVALQSALLEIANDASAADLLVARTVSPNFTSYYTVATAPVARDVSTFLDRYAELLPGFPLHAATHPPGAVLFYRAVLALCEGVPALTRGLVAQAERLGVDRTRFPSSVDLALLATALLAPAAIMLATSAACWPIAALARELGLSEAGATRVGMLWVLVPGMLLMVPELDQLLALPVVGTALLLLRALSPERSGPRSLAIGACAGAVAGLATLVSYGAVVFVLFGWLLVAAFALDRGRGAARRWPTLAVAAGGALIVHALPALWGYDPLRALSIAMRVHRELFTRPRPYATWLVLNLWDFAVFVGFPLAVLAAAGALGGARRLLAGGRDAAGAPLLRFNVATVAVLLALDLAGVARGEVGRIWIPLMPFVLVSSFLRPSSDAGAPPGARGTRRARPAPTARAPFEATDAEPSVRTTLVVAAMLLVCTLVLRIRWDMP
jgi:hypothetical protein